MKMIFCIGALLIFTTCAMGAKVTALATAPSSQPMAHAQPTAAHAQPTSFPTPAELIEKMRAMKKSKPGLPQVAYIDLSKRVTERPSDYFFFADPDATTLRSVVDRLLAAKDDKEIKAVLVTIGADCDLSLAQALEIRDALAAVKAAGKKTFVYADSYDTPAYVAASAASSVYMLEGGRIMIPGVGMEAMFAKGLLDKVGVKADYVQIGEYKGADERFTRTAASEQLKGELNKLADSLYQQIIEGISASRKLSKDDVRAIIDDVLLTAEAARDRGLVDDLVDQDGLRERIAKELHVKQIELVHNYGKEAQETPDLSNPFSIFAAMSRRPEPSGKPQIALVYLDGMIIDGKGSGSILSRAAAGSEDLRKALRTAAKDDDVKAVVLRIDSPGGSALASEVIWQAARRSQEKKPLIISIGSMAASGGYYVASAGDKIFADPSAIVGSIGVVGGKFVTHDLFDKLGLTTETFSRGANADLFSTTRPFDERQRTMLTRWMKQTYDLFVDRVMTTRSKSIKKVDEVARGRIFTAKQGKDLGLVDELGGLQDALSFAATKAALHEGDYEIRVLPQQKTLADYFGGDEDAAMPIRPSLNIAADSVLGALDKGARRALIEQAIAIQLLGQYPVVLVSPCTISVR